MRENTRKFLLQNLQIPIKQIYSYPDVVVGSDPMNDGSDYYLKRPCLIIEVLSRSTKRVGKREKLLAYQTLDRVPEYVLVHQK